MWCCINSAAKLSSSLLFLLSWKTPEFPCSSLGTTTNALLASSLQPFHCPTLASSLLLCAVLSGLCRVWLAGCSLQSHFLLLPCSGCLQCWAAHNPAVIKAGLSQCSNNPANLFGWIHSLGFLFPVLVMVQAFESCDNRQKVFLPAH